MKVIYIPIYTLVNYNEWKQAYSLILYCICLHGLNLEGHSLFSFSHTELQLQAAALQPALFPLHSNLAAFWLRGPGVLHIASRCRRKKTKTKTVLSFFYPRYYVRHIREVVHNWHSSGRGKEEGTQRMCQAQLHWLHCLERAPAPADPSMCGRITAGVGEAHREIKAHVSKRRIRKSSYIF